MGMMEIVGKRFEAKATAKAFRLLVFWVERVCASRFSFFGLLRIVMREGGRDWRTEGGDRGCASRFSLSRSLRMVMCGGERDWRTEGDDNSVFLMEGCDCDLAGFLRMLYGRGDTGEGEGGRYIVDKGLRVTSSGMVGSAECARVLAGLARIVMDWPFAMTRCSSGLLELFVPVVLGRLISRARSVTVGWRLTDHLSGRCTWSASHYGS
jgi:hypothetical protein